MRRLASEAVAAPSRFPREAPVASAPLLEAALLEAEGITLQYKTRDRLVTATWRVGFEVFPAERVVLLGPSGCGKSSLLKAVGGFVQPVEGSIRLRGRPVRDPGPDRMMVFQEFDQLAPWKTVRQNVVFPLLATRKLGRAEAEEKAMHVLAKVGLVPFADVYPHTLSGGMKQRVAIARALAMEPEMLLMDEPFASLDALTRRKMQDELLRLWEDVRFTLLFVTHSIEEAILVGTRILVMSPHPGQVRAELDCRRFDHRQLGSRELQAFQQRIHDMLFSDRIEEGPGHG